MNNKNEIDNVNTIIINLLDCQKDMLKYLSNKPNNHGITHLSALIDESLSKIKLNEGDLEAISL